jgi:hypothetical protein
LVDLGLLESSAPGRYRYHVLLRLFTFELAAEMSAERPLLRAAVRLLNRGYTASPDSVVPQWIT